MKRTFVIFTQENEFADNNDPIYGYVYGTNKDAQNACNDLNGKSKKYHYYMELDDLKQHGFQI